MRKFLKSAFLNENFRRRRRKFWKIWFFLYKLKRIGSLGWEFGVFFFHPKLPIRHKNPRLMGFWFCGRAQRGHKTKNPFGSIGFHIACVHEKFCLNTGYQDLTDFSKFRADFSFIKFHIHIIHIYTIFNHF